jgi:phosphoglycolate phosphatase
MAQKERMRKLLVFDWDGTLADSVNKIILCKQHLAKKHQLTKPSAKTVKAVMGMDFQLALERCFPLTDKETLKRFGEEFQTLMQTTIFQADLFPQTQAMLKHFKGIGLKLAIATSKSRKELNTAITHTELTDIFDLSCCAEEFRSKPNPNMLLHIMDELSTKPLDTLYIGDTIVDIDFARNANVDIACVSFGACSEEKLLKHQPKKIIHCWNDLLQGVEKSAI